MPQQISTTDIRGGHKIEIDGQPYVVISNDFVKPGKGRAINRIKMKNLLSGGTIERTFTSGDKINLADVSESPMRLLYKETDGAIFMDEKTFEQIKINFESMGDTTQWLMDDTLYNVIFYNGLPINVDPPIFMEMIITETAPGARGNTASGRVLKPATLQSGAKIQVPIFVEEGEKIRVDTRTGEYVSRVNE